MSPLPRRTPHRRPSLRTPFRTLSTIVATSVAVVAASLALATPAQSANRVTPGDFTGYGFDQCLAPTQAKMDTWWNESPFTAVGIYISGKSRACRSQPNLTKTWVSTQLARGWKLLPITLGPQASCQPRFPRYRDDVKINPSRTDDYRKARIQGLAEADSAVAAAKALGITAGSTLWYDLEGFDLGNTDCRESALRFLHAWTKRIRALGYVSGVYSSAGSGIKMLDDARVKRPGAFKLPDRIWIARWDGAANTSTSYLRADGWLPGGRMKQYRGGHNETWGGVTINIDSNYLDLGRGSQRMAAQKFCNGTTSADLRAYPSLAPGTTRATEVKVLQCLLKERGYYKGKLTGSYGSSTVTAVKAFQRARSAAVGSTWRPGDWTRLLTTGKSWVLKYGARGNPVSRIQRSLVSATGTALTVDGVFLKSTENLLKVWQGRVGLPRTGVMNPRSWALLKRGAR